MLREAPSALDVSRARAPWRWCQIEIVRHYAAHRERRELQQQRTLEALARGR